MNIFFPEHVWHLYLIDYMALSLKITRHNITQNFVSTYLSRQPKSGAPWHHVRSSLWRSGLENQKSICLFREL